MEQEVDTYLLIVNSRDGDTIIRELYFKSPSELRVNGFSGQTEIRHIPNACDKSQLLAVFDKSRTVVKLHK